MENSKKKIYKSIKENEDMIERNFKVINLDVDNLAHYQINKIEQRIENHQKTYNNINIHKLLNENAINSIDIYNTKIPTTYIRSLILEWSIDQNILFSAGQSPHPRAAGAEYGSNIVKNAKKIEAMLCCSK